MWALVQAIYCASDYDLFDGSRSGRPVEFDVDALKSEVWSEVKYTEIIKKPWVHMANCTKASTWNWQDT